MYTFMHSDGAATVGRVVITAIVGLGVIIDRESEFFATGAKRSFSKAEIFLKGGLYAG
jgi:hypothetical protein